MAHAAGRPPLVRLSGDRLAVVDLRASVLELMIRASLSQPELAEIISVVEPISFAQMREDVPLRAFCDDRAVNVSIVARRWALYQLVLFTLTEIKGKPFTALQRVIAHAMRKGRLRFSTVLFKSEDSLEASRHWLTERRRSSKWGDGDTMALVVRNQTFRQAAHQYLVDVRRQAMRAFPAALRAGRDEIRRLLDAGEAEGYRGFRGLYGEGHTTQIRRRVIERRAAIIAQLYSETRQTLTNLARMESFTTEPLSDGEHLVRTRLYGRDMGGRMLDPLASGGSPWVDLSNLDERKKAGK